MIEDNLTEKICDYCKDNQKGIYATKAELNTAKTDLTTEINKKANDADLAAIAKSGSTDDLVQGAITLVFDCGTSAV